MEQRYADMARLLERVVRARRRAAEEKFRPLDIHPAQHFLLMHLYHEGRMESQTRIARHMDVSPALVARSLKSLEAAGYIAREDGSDLRRNEIVLTEKGMNVVDESRRRFVELDDLSFKGFTPEEFDTLTGYLERILGNLNEETKGENDK